MAVVKLISIAASGVYDNKLLCSLLAVCSWTTFVLLRACYNVLYHPLKRYPGPTLWGASRLPYAYWLWQGRLHEAIKHLHDTHGPVVRIAPDELSFNTNPAWEDIYCGGSGNKGFPKHAAYTNVQTFESLFDASDANHTRLRKLLKNDFFSLRAARRQEAVVQEFADRLIDNLRDHCVGQNKQAPQARPADVRTWYNWATFDIIGKVTLSEDFGCLQGRAYHPWLLMVVTHFKLSALLMVIRLYPPLPQVLTRLAPARLLRLQETFLSLIRQSVDGRRQRVLPEGEQDFVSAALREGMEKNDELDRLALTPDELEANCILLLLAGSETIATSLLSATHLLCENPTAMRRLKEEVRAVSEGEVDFETTASNMPYLNAVIRESHRLCPPLANGPARVTGSDPTIIAGCPVPPHTTVSVTPYAANRSANHFSRSESFCPERWLTPEQAESYTLRDDGWNHDEFVADMREVVRPFSAGGRDCLGKNFAWVEFRVLLARVIWNFDLEVCRDGEGEAFRTWEDQRAFMLWEKQCYSVWVKERKSVGG